EEAHARGVALAQHFGYVAVYVVAALRHAEGDHRHGHEGDRDVAHAAAEADADAREVFLLQLGEDDRLALVHRPGLVAERLEEALEHGLVVDEPAAHALALAGDAEAERLAFERARHQQLDVALDHLVA